MGKEANVTIVFNRRKTATRQRAERPVTGSVEIQIYKDGRRKWFSTGVKVYLDQWNNGIVVNRLDSAELNIAIRKVYEKAVDVCRSGDAMALSRAQTANRSFCEWLEEQILSRTDIRDNTRKDHLALLHVLEVWGEFRRFRDVNRAAVERWDKWLHAQGYKQSTVHSRHKALKVYLKKALDMGLISSWPYGTVKISRGRNVDVKYLVDSQREAIEGAKVSGMVAMARDMFLFGCYTGLAYSDVVRVSRGNIEEEDGELFLVDKRLKTGTGYRLMLLPRAREILERYGYDLNLMSNQKLNVMLKALAGAAGIEGNLTMHMSRHTFATWALRNGVPIEVVSKMLAHSNIATTQIYAHVLQSEVKSGFMSLKDVVAKEKK